MAGNVMTITREDPFPALEKFWKLDTFNTDVPAMTVQERLCEEHFLSNVQFCPDQRLMVRLPFAENPRELGKTLALAQRRFSSIERRLERDPAMLEGYVSYMDEYERLNHMTEVQLSSVPRNQYFIPHHCVLKPDSSTTKLRVVFDASAQSSTGKRLNNILRVGPTVQSDLLSILLQFRTHRFVFTEDVEKMYRQIWVHPQDRGYQLTVWRRNPLEKKRYFHLNTVTYGTALLSNKMFTTSGTESADKPAARRGRHSAKLLCRRLLIGSRHAGGDDTATRSELCNFRVGKTKVEEVVRKSPRLTQGYSKGRPGEDLDFSEFSDATIKTLGIVWNPKEDKLEGRATPYEQGTVTKRVVCSELAKVFDPLGLLCPITTAAKLFMQ